MSSSDNFGFLHHLYDTIVLLGGKKEIAELLKKSHDELLESDVNDLRNYNCGLIDATKDKLTRINKKMVLVKGDN